MICQYPMQDVDKLRHHLIDRQTAIDQSTDQWWFWADGKSCGQRWTFWTFDI